MDLVDFFEKFIKIVMRYWDVFLIKGLSTTLALSAIAVFFGAIIGTLLAFGKMGKSRILRGIITAYVEIIRGTPSLLQVYVGYFVVPLLPPPLNVSTYASVAIALTINSSAYVSEVIRSGIQAVDKGQMEAARSLGLTQSQAMIKVVLPQAVKNILPAIGNEFVTMVKETSIIQYLGISDLMYNNGIVITATYNPLPCYYISALIYLTLNICLGKGLNIFEGRMKKSER